MQQLRSYADERLVASCVYCGNVTETRDHVPSRILLDEPYPENLPVVPSGPCFRLHTPLIETGLADCPHPALGESLTRSPTENCGSV
jgi:hypothetical protein